MSLIEQAAQRLEQLRNVGVDIPPQSVAASVPETKPEQAKPLETIPQAAPAPAQDDQPLMDTGGQHQAENPDDDDRRVEDDPAQAVLAFDPLGVLFGPHRALMMIDEETRHHEQPRHHEDDEDHMRRLHPQHRRPQKSDPVRHCPTRLARA